MVFAPIRAQLGALIPHSVRICTSYAYMRSASKDGMVRRRGIGLMAVNENGKKEVGRVFGWTLCD
jgi:hypothetical protein